MLTVAIRRSRLIAKSAPSLTAEPKLASGRSNHVATESFDRGPFHLQIPIRQLFSQGPERVTADKNNKGPLWCVWGAVCKRVSRSPTCRSLLNSRFLVGRRVSGRASVGCRCDSATALSSLTTIRRDGDQAASSNSSWRSRWAGVMGGALTGRPIAVRKAWMATGWVRAATIFM